MENEKYSAAAKAEKAGGDKKGYSISCKNKKKSHFNKHKKFLGRCTTKKRGGGR